MQRELAFRCDAVSDGTLELRIQRQHGAEDFAERGKIVVGDPTAETQELVIEYRNSVEYALNSFGCDRGLTVVQFEDNAGQALLAEGHEHAAADQGSDLGADAIGKDHVERHGQGDVAELGHCWKDKLENSLKPHTITGCQAERKRGTLVLACAMKSAAARRHQGPSLMLGMTTLRYVNGPEYGLLPGFFRRLDAQVFHHHLQILPGLALLARISQQECGMVGDGQARARPGGIAAANARGFEVVKSAA